MDLGIRGKVALVAGASSGIGEAVALALAREGAKVAVAARRRERLEDVASRARQAGAPDARAVVADQTDGASLAGAVRTVEAELGPVEILIVNGGGPRPGTYTQVSARDWDAAYALTMQSALRLVEAVLPGMRARRWGRIVALESISVKQPIPTLVLSNAFRTAVVSALKTLSMEVAAEGITINSIATGLVETDRFRSIYDTAAKRQEALAQVPMKRAASPDEYAPLVAFLCGEPARYVTGQTISIDGGRIAGLFG
ncbi:MAG TPA: SDR family oxidoreductase [Myxococcales bacterium]|nr:SDR family oxidoreductase [Myxococcales bacterium]